jgi:hypothetical protein
MKSDSHDAPRWEECFFAQTAAPERRTPIDEEPWALYRGAGAETIAPTYVEAYLERLDGDAGWPIAREKRRRAPGS